MLGHVHKNLILCVWEEHYGNLTCKLKASIQTHNIKQASTSVFLLYYASLSQVIIMILCVMRGPDSTSRAQSNSQPSAISYAFQPDGCSSYFLVGNSVQAKLSKAIQLWSTCMIWIEISTLIYTIY